MNNQSTPETDLNECWPASNLKLGDSSVVPAKFARKLERERDEAREAWYEMQSSFERSRDEVEKLIRERDAAMELLKIQSDIIAEMRRPADQQISELEMSLAVKSQLCNKLERERDEARSEVEKLQDALMQIKNSCVDFADAFDVFIKIHQITVTALNSKIAK